MSVALTVEHRTYTYELGVTPGIGMTYSSLTITVTATIRHDRPSEPVTIDTTVEARTMSGGRVARPLFDQAQVDLAVTGAIRMLNSDRTLVVTRTPKFGR